MTDDALKPVIDAARERGDTIICAGEEDLTAGTMAIHVYYLGCGHVTWMVCPPGQPPATTYCKGCDHEAAVMGYEANQVLEVSDRIPRWDGTDPWETSAAPTCPVCGNAHTNDVCGSEGCICEALNLP